MDRRTLIQQTISAVQDALEHLDMERERIAYEIAEKTELLKTWRKELAQIASGKTGGNGQRLARGEPLRRVNELYDSDPRARQNGLTVKEIETATDLGWTTCRNVVRGQKNGFVEVDGGRWRRTSDIEKEKKPPLKAVS